MHYYLGPWYAYKLARSQLPFETYARPGGRITVLGETVGKRGLPLILERSERIKEFGLGEAIKYSYLRDIRFVLVLCGMIGVTARCALAPDQLLMEPKALCTTDIELLSRVARDTYEAKVCSSHQVTSPCECGEPLNNEIKKFLGEPLNYDPLEIEKTRKIKGVATLIGSIVLSLALAESVSLIGVKSDV